MSRPYTGNKDLRDGPRPGTVRFMDYLVFLIGGSNRGIYARRSVRGGKGTSVHQTGRALDYGGSLAQVRQAIEFTYRHREIFQVEEIHDYIGAWIPSKGFGAGYRCSRDRGGLFAGWKIYDKPTIGPGGRWTHIELAPEIADSPELVDQAMIAIFEKK